MLSFDQKNLILTCLAFIAGAFFFGFLDSILRRPKRVESEQGPNEDF